MSIERLDGVVTVRFRRSGYDPQTGRPVFTRELIRFADFTHGDVINVPSDQGDADDVLSYVARKLNVSTDSLELSEWRHFWQIRYRYGETI